MMNRFKLCFIFDESGNYQAVPYTKLMDGEVRRSEYAGRYFIPLDGFLLEVSREDYKEFYQIKNRREYVRKEAKRVGEISMDSDAPHDEEVSRMAYMDVAEQSIFNIMVAQLHDAIAKLRPTDQRLIQLLYFEGKTERQCAEIFGVYRNAIHVRKEKVLEKLGKFLR